jgi:hypothetical protein
VEENRSAYYILDQEQLGVKKLQSQHKKIRKQAKVNVREVMDRVGTTQNKLSAGRGTSVYA